MTHDYIQEVRDRLPEPSTCAEEVYYFMEPPPIFYDFPSNNDLTPITKHEFVKRLVHESGVSYWAWTFKGKVYY